MNESRLVKGRVSILSARQYKLSYLELEWLVEQLISSQYYLFVQIIMYMETEFTKGSSPSSAPSPLPSAPPQNDHHFNYHTVPPPVPTNIELITTGIPVMNSSIQPPIPWSTGLCHCYDDPCICCLTCWCPCVTFGRIAEITDKGSIWCGLSGTLFTILLVTGCSFWYSCCYRSKLRAQYSLEESPCLDCCVHFCCQSCALCQEYRELKKRGFDLSIGWQKNVERQIRGASVHPPIVQQPMHR